MIDRQEERLVLIGLDEEREMSRLKQEFEMARAVKAARMPCSIGSMIMRDMKIEQSEYDCTFDEALWLCTSQALKPKKDVEPVPECLAQAVSRAVRKPMIQSERELMMRALMPETKLDLEGSTSLAAAQDSRQWAKDIYRPRKSMSERLVVQPSIHPLFRTKVKVR